MNDAEFEAHMERACALAARALIWARKDGYKEGLAAQPEEVLACLP